MGEDQDPACARRLHEPQRRDRLAGARRVLEPEAARRAGIVGRRGRHVGRLLLVAPVERLVLVLVDHVVLEHGLQVVVIVIEVKVVVWLELGDRLLGREAVAIAVPAVPVRAGGRLELGDQRHERAGERVDLVGGELGPVGEVGLLLGEQPFQAKHERVLALPLNGGHVPAGLELCQGVVERPPAGAVRRQHGRGVLPLVHEGLARELLGARQVCLRNRRGGDQGLGCSHCRLLCT